MIGRHQGTTLTFNTEDYETLTIGSVSTTSTEASGSYSGYNSPAKISLKSGDTVITSLSNGNSNIVVDISDYDSITIYIDEGAARSQTVALNNVTFS